MSIPAEALSGFANLLTHAMKTKALDPTGEFLLGRPEIDTHPESGAQERRGELVHRLALGCGLVEVWWGESS